MKSAIAAIGSDAGLAPVEARHGGVARPSRQSLAPPRDHVGLVVEPQPAVLAQHLAGGIEIAAVGDHLGQPVVLDLRHVDRGVPGREQRRGADRPPEISDGSVCMS